MTIASNLYASRVFSQHPISLWPLDDDISYLSLLGSTGESKRDVTTWTLTNCTASNPTSGEIFLSRPFDNSVTTTVESSSLGSTITAISPDVFDIGSLNPINKSFGIQLFLYSEGSSVQYYELGYRYLDPATSLYVEDVQAFFGVPFNAWTKIGATFLPPNLSVNAQIIFRAYFSNTDTPQRITVNGLSVGQWSENTNDVSLGAVSKSLSDTSLSDLITSGSYEVIPIDQYGVSSEEGYIFVEDGRPLAINYGIPMVFGSDNVTRVYPPINPGTLPSIAIPGKGFLNESGRYASYTTELWIKIRNNSNTLTKIFGQIDSYDGLYIKGPFIYYIIGNSVISHFVSEWARPMVVHMTYSTNFATLMINGDIVGEMRFDSDTIDMASASGDWLGVYSTPGQELFELDAISIMPYLLPEQLAKKRFVWGQAVDTPEEINSAFRGTVSYIDFPFAEYAHNEIYPDVALWDAGYTNNLESNRYFLSVPDYDLPDFKIGGRTLEDFYKDNVAIQSYFDNNFIKLQPNSSWSDNSYIYFDNFNFLQEPIKSVFAVLSTTNLSGGQQNVLTMVNNQNQNTFSIILNDDDISYEMVVNGESIINDTMHDAMIISSGTKFVVGFTIDKLIETFGLEVNQFFSNPGAIKTFFGGNGENMFLGNIYRLDFCNQYTTDEYATLFDSNGIAKFDQAASIDFEQMSSYTLFPIKDSGPNQRFYLDIGVKGYWSEYFPLSRFATFVQETNNKAVYDFDFIQYNVDYPSVFDVDDPWEYEELNLEYEDYQALLDSGLTYAQINDLYGHVLTFSMSHNMVRSFISFQRTSLGANRIWSDFAIQERLRFNSVVDSEKYSDPLSTAFEIKDNCIIYPDRTYGLDDTSLVLQLLFNVPGIKRNRVRIKRMSLASKASSSLNNNAIGTRFGSKLYPYTKNDFYYDYKEKNPFLISKESAPHLYLSDKYGIELKQGEYGEDRGIAFPININKLNTFSISSVQMWLKLTDNLPGSPIPIFDIDYRYGSIEFMLETDDTEQRALIYARDKNTKEPYTDVYFYKNGISVITPYLIKDQWTVLSVNFAQALDFESYLGYINLHEGFSFNNIAHYETTNIREVANVKIRTWSLVENDFNLIQEFPEYVEGEFTSTTRPTSPTTGDIIYETDTQQFSVYNGTTWEEYNIPWDYWLGSSPNYNSWNYVLKIDEGDAGGVTGSELFKAYTGTNRRTVVSNTGIGIGTGKVQIINAPVFRDPSYIRKPE